MLEKVDTLNADVSEEVNKFFPVRPKATIVKEVDTIANILAERQKTHGDYSEHARITQELKSVLRSSPGWDKLTDCQKETLEMIAHKAGRTLAGDPDFKDHWDDIAGYSKLVSDRCSK